MNVTYVCYVIVTLMKRCYGIVKKNKKLFKKSVVLPSLFFAFLSVSYMSNEAKANAVNNYIKQGMTTKGWKSPTEQDRTGSIPIKNAYATGKGRPTCVILHETANNNSNINGEISYMLRNYNNAFVHEFVDANNIIGIADTDYLSWGAGPRGNSKGIQVEQVRMHSKDDFAKELMNLSTFTVNMLRQYKLSPSMGNSSGGGTIWTHAMVSRYLGGTNHTDPDGYWSDRAKSYFNSGYTINDFYALVTDMYNGKIQEVKPANVNATTKITQNGSKFDVTVNVTGDTNRVTNVQLPTWSSNGGQKDIRWYNAKKVNNSTYTFSIPMSDYKKYGTFLLHTYVYTNDNKSRSFNGGTFNYTSPKVSTVTTYVPVNGKLVCRTTLSGDVNRVSNVSFPIWTKSNQSDLKWNQATKKSNNVWEYVYDGLKNAPYGMVNVHTYVTVDEWESRNLATNGWNFAQPNIKSSMVADIKDQTATITMNLTGNDSDLASIASVSFPTWFSGDGKQDGLNYISGKKVNNKTYTATVNLNDYKKYGKYQTDGYVTTSGNRTIGVGGVSYEVKQPIITQKSSIEVDKNIATITTVIDGDYKSVSSVRNPVWATNNQQKDLIWYEAKRINDTTYESKVDLIKHGIDGEYTVHSYAYFNGWGSVNEDVGRFTWKNDSGLTVISSYNVDTVSVISSDDKETFYVNNPPLSIGGGKKSDLISSRNKQTFRTLRKTELPNGETYDYGLFGDNQYYWVNSKYLKNTMSTPVQTHSLSGTSLTKKYATIKDNVNDIREGDIRYRLPSKYSNTKSVKDSNSANSANIQIIREVRFNNGETWFEFTQSNKNGQSMGYVNSKDIK